MLLVFRNSDYLGGEIMDVENLYPPGRKRKLNHQLDPELNAPTNLQGILQSAKESLLGSLSPKN